MQSRNGRNGHRGRCAVGTVINHPFQHVLGARRRLVEPLLGPKHPVGLVRQHLQREQLAPVVSAVPAYRAVAIGRDHNPSIPAGVDGPDLAARLPSPFDCSSVVVRRKSKTRTEKESFAVLGYCEAPRLIILFDPDWVAGQPRALAVSPIDDRQPLRLARTQPVLKGDATQAKRPYVKTEPRVGAVAKPEVDDFPSAEIRKASV